jgi:hypothetical protein
VSRARTHAPPQKAAARPVSKPHDSHEREAERAGDVVARGGSVAGWSFSAVPAAAPEPVQRQEVVKEKSDDEKKKEALTKTGEAILETPAAKVVKEKVLADPLVKTVKDAVTSPAGLVTTGVVAAGGVAALGAAKKPLPFQPPSIPLDKITPGLSAQVKYEGPVNAPTFVGLTITYKEQGPKGKKTKSDDYAAQTAALKAQQQDMFKPASQRAAEKQADDDAVQAYVKGLPPLTIPLTPGPAKQDDAPKKDEERTPVQPAPESASATTPEYADVGDAFSTSGRALDQSTRHAMEARFGYDFSAVRVHDDAHAAATAAEIHAAAFTVGQDIVFGTGGYAPSTSRGRELLAHELAHTVQQSGTDKKAPPIAPGSALESAAEAAGHTAARGGDVTQPLGTSGLGIARAPRPDYLNAYDDTQLEEQARMLREMLRKRPEYPDRDADVRFLSEVTTEVERRGAAAESEAALAQLGKEPEDEAPEPAPTTSMALPTGKPRTKPKPGTAAAPQRPRRKAAAPSKFDPGGFTNEDIERPWKESEKRIEAESRPNPTPFMDRFYAARRLTSEGDTSNAMSVWEVGRREGLFTEDDRWAFDETWAQKIGKPAHDEAKQHARTESIQKEMAWEAKGEALRSPEPFIQPFAMGAFGKAVALGYAAYSGIQSGLDVGHAVQSGKPEDMVTAGIGVGTTLLSHQLTSSGAEPVTESGAPVEVTPDDVRAAFQADPATVKRSLTSSRHQSNYQSHGGTDTAPLAYRHPSGRVIVVDEQRWPTVGDLSEINQPHELGPPRGEAALKKEAMAGHPDATARTMPDPRAPTVPASEATPGAGGAEQPAGPVTQGTAPRAPRAPAPARSPMKPAVAASAEEVAEAYRADPSSVHRSTSKEWHEQIWHMDKGDAPRAPRAFRSGRTFIVDPDFPL